jgi:putative transposase
MGYRRQPFAPGEWYHCYTRGIDKRTVFHDKGDRNRFLEALYLCNSIKTIERDNIKHLPHSEILQRERKGPLVGIGAYALMPNHFHILLKEVEEGGTAKFMQKVGTSYAMYYNLKYEHIGNLFVKPFRSKHVADDRYLRRVISYIHLNSVELFEPGWKEGRVKNFIALKKFLEQYQYSSLPDYLGNKRPERSLLDWVSIKNLLSEHVPPLKKLLPEMASYYQELNQPPRRRRLRG